MPNATGIDPTETQAATVLGWSATLAITNAVGVAACAWWLYELATAPHRRTALDVFVASLVVACGLLAVVCGVESLLDWVQTSWHHSMVRTAWQCWLDAWWHANSQLMQITSVAAIALKNERHIVAVREWSARLAWVVTVVGWLICGVVSAILGCVSTAQPMGWGTMCAFDVRSPVVIGLLAPACGICFTVVVVCYVRVFRAARESLFDGELRQRSKLTRWVARGSTLFVLVFVLGWMPWFVVAIGDWFVPLSDTWTCWAHELSALHAVTSVGTYTLMLPAYRSRLRRWCGGVALIDNETPRAGRLVSPSSSPRTERTPLVAAVTTTTTEDPLSPGTSSHSSSGSTTPLSCPTPAGMPSPRIARWQNQRGRRPPNGRVKSTHHHQRTALIVSPRAHRQFLSVEDALRRPRSPPPDRPLSPLPPEPPESWTLPGELPALDFTTVVAEPDEQHVTIVDLR